MCEILIALDINFCEIIPPISSKIRLSSPMLFFVSSKILNLCRCVWIVLSIIALANMIFTSSLSDLRMALGKTTKLHNRLLSLSYDLNYVRYPDADILNVTLLRWTYIQLNGLFTLGIIYTPW